ncbi:MAG TPA: inositol monophosphatase family protein [Bryobacteraceae bacterium]|jgi:histidinol-phosphatase|nr:inositol monophosphatase family protein [Bryobacteraceae bacterium]
MSFEKELEVARKIAFQAAELALEHQRRGVAAETKPDDSPVTIADRECERLIASALEENFPEDGLLGEEGARKDSRSGRRWIIDPIDGTRDFVRGNPLWGVLIGLEDRGEVAAGVVHLPMLSQTSWSARGCGAFRNGERLCVSSIADPSRAVLSVNALTRIQNQRFSRDLIDFIGRFWSFRCLGGTPDAIMLAAGENDAWIEPMVSPWDLAAPQVILEEAGAKFFSFTGERTIYGGNAIACNPALETLLREYFAGGSQELAG